MTSVFIIFETPPPSDRPTDRIIYRLDEAEVSRSPPISDNHPPLHPPPSSFSIDTNFSRGESIEFFYYSGKE